MNDSGPQKNLRIPVSASGGTLPYTWAAGQGFPSFFSLDTNTGIISGTPATPGSFSFPVQVTDAVRNTATGTVSVTLATMSPSVVMGLGIGTPNGTTSCTLTSSTPSATAGSTPQLTVTEQAGSYCISVYDVGNLTGTGTFTVTVSHP